MISELGKVYGCGINENGELGIDIREPFLDFVTEVEALGSKTIVQVAAGHNHSLFRSTEGEVFACGDNSGF